MIKIMTEIEAIEIIPQMANAISCNKIKIFYKDGAGPYILNSSGHLFDKNGNPITLFFPN